MYGPWVLSYGDVHYEFGLPHHSVQFVELIEASDSLRADDMAVARGDGVTFGRDYLSPGERVLKLLINHSSKPVSLEEKHRLAWADRMRFKNVWQARELRDSPGMVASLVMGGEQMIQGRPRRISFDDSHMGFGFIEITATFVPDSNAVYEVDGGIVPWHEATTSIAPARIGTLVAPLVAPVSTAIGSGRSTGFDVGGSAAVWPVIDITGPIQSGARLQVVGIWEIVLNRALASGENVSITTEPGRQNMKLNGAWRNVLSPAGNYIDDLSIMPGRHALALYGKSVEGTATARLRWRERKAT